MGRYATSSKGAEQSTAVASGTAAVTKGRFVIPAKSIGLTFMFNPNDVTDEKYASWGSTELPGASHPNLQYGAGGARTISFDIWLDGDRGQVAMPGKSSGTLSVKAYLNMLRGLMYPGAYSKSVGDVYPYLVIFSLGDMYQSVPCILRKCSQKINFWTPKMEPVKATVSVSLDEVSPRSQTFDDVYSGGNL